MIVRTPEASGNQLNKMKSDCQKIKKYLIRQCHVEKRGQETAERNALLELTFDQIDEEAKKYGMAPDKKN